VTVAHNLAVDATTPREKALATVGLVAARPMRPLFCDERTGARMLSDQEVIAIVRIHVESKFPKQCRTCGRTYVSLADYLARTTHLGTPMTADDPFDATSERLIGTVSYANCPCGSTLAINSSGLDLLTMRQLLEWAGASVVRRGISINELLGELRGHIDEEVLHEACDTAPALPPVRYARRHDDRRRIGGAQHDGANRRAGDRRATQQTAVDPHRLP
jgi:hypothetical protein